MLQVTDLAVEFKGLRVLNGLSLDVPSGQTVGIIGPNGSGKTTFFNCLSGFVLPRGGSIIFRGQNITDLRPHLRASLGMGRVFQNPGIFRDMSLIENVVLAIEGRQPGYRTFFPFSPAHRRNVDQARSYLEDIKLGARSKEKASSLSGGQMRLLEIVRTLAFGAELFLLDEPTAGVSPKMKDEVASLIEKLRRLKKTTLIIEHDLNFIERFCDRIVVLDGGKAILDGPPPEIRSSPILREIYFGNDGSGKSQHCS